MTANRQFREFARDAIFVLSQCVLVATVIWLGVTTDISESGLYFAGGLIATYGALIAASVQLGKTHR